MNRLFFYIFLILVFCSSGFADIITFKCPNSKHILDTDKKTLKSIDKNGKVKKFPTKSMDKTTIVYSVNQKNYKFNYGGDGKIYQIEPQFKELAFCKRINVEVSQTQKTTTASSSSVATTETKEDKLAATDELRVVQVNKKIINVELFPKIKKTSSIDLISVDAKDSNKINEILNNSSNILFIIPKDYESSSNRISESKRISQYKAGETLVPNPERNRIEMQIRDRERRQQIAFSEIRKNEPLARKQCGNDWMCIAQAAASSIQVSRAKDAVINFNREIDNLISRLDSTPYEIARPSYFSYEYIEATVSAEKKAIYTVIKVEKNNYSEKEITFEKKKEFKMADGIRPEDRNYNALKNKYVSTSDVNAWQKKKFSDVSYSTFSEKINSEGIFEKIRNKNKLLSKIGSTKSSQSSGESLWTKIEEWWEGDSKPSTSDARFNSVVIVKTDKGIGAGFYVGSDEVLTNYHVVEDSLSIMLEDNKGKKSSAVLIKQDLSRDLALLKTNARGKAVQFFRGELKQGSSVEALGHPQRLKFSLTRGVVSSIRKYHSTYSATGEANVLFIQTDAAINPGNSGGPLYFGDKVVGVNTQGLAKDKTEGLNFAVHFSEVQTFLRK